jgi:hypothetical protein
MKRTTRSIRDHVDQLVHQQSTLIAVALRVQQQHNSHNLEKRYKNYKRIPNVKPTRFGDESFPRMVDDNVTLSPISLTTNTESLTVPVLGLPSEAAPHTHDPVKVYDWVWDSSLIPPRYVRTSQRSVGDIPVIELDMAPYQLTTYTVGDFVLRQYPPSKAGNGPPNKYGSWWRGPYEVTHIQQTDIKQVYTIRHLVTQKEYLVDVTHLKPFYHDPTYVVPLNIAVKDTDEYVVENIIAHDVSNPKDTKWRVRWAGYGDSDDSWEPLTNIKDVEVFHEYCVAHKLQRFLPRKHSKRMREGGDEHAKRVKL